MDRINIGIIVIIVITLIVVNVLYKYEILKVSKQGMISIDMVLGILLLGSIGFGIQDYYIKKSNKPNDELEMYYY